MILGRISASLVIDQIVTEESENFAHFISHLDERLQVPNTWHSIIYTSKHIANLLALKLAPIPKKYIQILKKDKRYLIQLPGRTCVTVTMFESDELRGNVMFCFQTDESKNILYSGPVVKLDPFSANRLLRRCIRSRIDELYVDNTRVESIQTETIESASNRMSDIIKKHPGYLIMMNIPVFGYEDFVYQLANKYGHKVFVGDRICSFKKVKFDIFAKRVEDAEILVGQGKITEDILKRRFEEKRLTVIFKESSFEPQNPLGEYGAYCLYWTPHPSLTELNKLVNFVRPYKIERIYEDMPALPEFLTSLCTNDCMFHRGFLPIPGNSTKSKLSNTFVFDYLFSDENNNSGNNTDSEIGSVNSRDSMGDSDVNILDDDISNISISYGISEELATIAKHDASVFLSQPVRKSSNHQNNIGLTMDSLSRRSTHESQKRDRLPIRVPLKKKIRCPFDVATPGNSNNLRNAHAENNTAVLDHDVSLLSLSDQLRTTPGTSDGIVNLTHKYKTTAFSQPATVKYIEDGSSDDSN